MVCENTRRAHVPLFFAGQTKQAYLEIRQQSQFSAAFDDCQNHLAKELRLHHAFAENVLITTGQTQWHPLESGARKSPIKTSERCHLINNQSEE